VAITVEQTEDGSWSVDYRDGFQRDFDEAATAIKAAETAANLERRGYIVIERRPEWLRGT
jgi:hypothetical protein